MLFIKKSAAKHAPSDIILFMVQVNNKLGALGWELKASLNQESRQTDELCYDYYITHSMLFDDSQDNMEYPCFMAVSRNNSHNRNLNWEVDVLALIKSQRRIKFKTNGNYDYHDINAIKDNMYRLFLNLIPKSEHYFLNELSCLVWLNNMNYNPILSFMVRNSEQTIKKYINVMCKIRSDYNQMQDFAKDAVDIVLLPDSFFKAFI